MTIDSEFDQTLGNEPDSQRRRDQQLAILLTHMRMANAQLADYAVQQHATEKWRQKMEQNLEQNTAITTEVRELLDTFKGGMRVLYWLGVLAKWVGGIASAGAAIYTVVHMLIHGGSLPGSK